MSFIAYGKIVPGINLFKRRVLPTEIGWNQSWKEDEMLASVRLKSSFVELAD